MRDISDGAPVLLAATLAALEAGDVDWCERLAQFALAETKPVQLVATAPLELVLGRVALIRGERTRAEERAASALAFTSERGTRTWLADTLDLFGRAAAGAEAWAEGCRLLAASDAFRQSTGQLRLPSAQREVDVMFEAAAAALGESIEAARSEGKGLTVEDAVGRALRTRSERQRSAPGNHPAP
jgi:ATP/maltotriose-dependent transcriptional regulator MalT